MPIATHLYGADVSFSSYLSGLRLPDLDNGLLEVIFGGTEADSEKNLFVPGSPMALTGTPSIAARSVNLNTAAAAPRGLTTNLLAIPDSTWVLVAKKPTGSMGVLCSTGNNATPQLVTHGFTSTGSSSLRFHNSNFGGGGLASISHPGDQGAAFGLYFGWGTELGHPHIQMALGPNGELATAIEGSGNGFARSATAPLLGGNTANGTAGNLDVAFAAILPGIKDDAWRIRCAELVYYQFGDLISLYDAT